MKDAVLRARHSLMPTDRPSTGPTLRASKGRFRLLQVLGGDGRGGADQVALALADGLHEQGFAVAFFVPEGFVRHQRERLRGRAVTVAQSFSPFSVATLGALRRAAQGTDLVLTHDSPARHLTLTAKALGDLQAPLWFMRHCIVRPPALPWAPWQRLWVAHQLAASEVIAESLVASGYPAQRVTRLYAGRDLSSFFTADSPTIGVLRGRLGLDLHPAPFCIGMVARFDRWSGWHPEVAHPKGFDVLFAALSRLDFPYRVLLLGPPHPEDHEALRAMAQIHGARPDWLIFLGFQNDISAYYGLMDVNVLPSRREGLGLALVEGLAAGVPVLGSGSGGIREVIRDGHNGFFFPEGDAVALAGLLIRLAQDPELRRRLGEEGRRQLQEAAFDEGHLVDGFMDCLAREHPVSVQGERMP
ncbi:glycosyltransferase [Acidithiobacillus sp. 'AMD consortium']|uniref:Glycosyltransferase n=2 Tax=Acidithiobacillus ferridurans TaxID=1232575 RepID=A0A8X8GFC6_ACIFI|nr:MULTISPECIES: glycosyltransferase [Acidithiobacillus]MBU2715954.1 glycosyltransferase [Acidithiobacillus ferridurans]MBU2719127.1 glycosyltransferase [Acidithiobacillus ferridurans]MBU2724924.1 glycosyltransferase [Acidithiobacillus ferridurans]MBU2727407.1 glycosyltransferase [Acidithiobacillus ferridurans]MBU2806056.1 glycosyltransferase [Acidithiobacillus ferridurans]